jgi:PEP-CTERM motif
MRELNISRPVKMFLVLTVAFFGPGLMVASADSVNLSGTFTNGESFTGTVITTPGTPGTITSGSLTVSGGADAGVYNDFYVADFGVYLFQDSLSPVSPSTYPYIDLLFSDASPISEASLCTDASLCGSSASQLRVSSDGNFSDLQAAVATPEPGSLLLLVSGLVGLGLLFRKQRLATN